MSDSSESSGIDSHCPELLLRCVKTLEMDDKAKFEEEEDRFYLHTNGLERQTSAWGTAHIAARSRVGADGVTCAEHYEE